MKRVILTIISIIFGLVAISFSLYLEFLVLTHIHATDLMWFVFWINIPMLLIFQLVSKLVELMGEEG